MSGAGACASADQVFIECCPRLLDTSIMMTHYSQARLFSAEARAGFVEPDLTPIPFGGRREIGPPLMYFRLYAVPSALVIPESVVDGCGLGRFLCSADGRLGVVSGAKTAQCSSGAGSSGIGAVSFGISLPVIGLALLPAMLLIVVWSLVRWLGNSPAA